MVEFSLFISGEMTLYFSLEQARGHWKYLLIDVGIQPELLNGNHTKCPICGGKDRFRFDDKDGYGTYYCNGCGAGGGFALLQKYKGFDNKEAMTFIKEKLVGKSTHIIENKSKDIEENKTRISAILKDKVPIQESKTGVNYFKSRGLSVEGISDVYFVDNCWHGLLQNGQSMYRPAIVSMLRNGDSMKIVSCHITYLGNRDEFGDLPVRKVMASIEKSKLSRQIIMLNQIPSNGLIGIGEGIESTLSAGVIFKVPVWSAVSASSLERWNPPAGVKKVFVFSDNDKSYIGQAASYKLANRLFIKGVNVEVKVPTMAGQDWNDVLLEIG